LAIAGLQIIISKNDNVLFTNSPLLLNIEAKITHFCV